MQNVEIKKSVLGILIGLCKCMRGAFDCINKAAVNTARRSNQSPFANLLNALSINDIDLRISILTLINWLLFKCPSGIIIVNLMLYIRKEDVQVFG